MNKKSRQKEKQLFAGLSIVQIEKETEKAHEGLDGKFRRQRIGTQRKFQMVNAVLPKFVEQTELFLNQKKFSRERSIQRSGVQCG